MAGFFTWSVKTPPVQVFFIFLRAVKSIFILYVLVSGFYGINFAQEPVHRNFSVPDGLPSSEVFHVLQDSKGYIWFATNAGVSRYDGYSFKTFDLSNGLPDNTVFEIYEDMKGRIWFVPFSCKLSYFYNDSIRLFQYNNRLQKKLLSPNPIKKSFYIDTEENIYIGVYGHPVFKISKNGTISELRHYDISESNVNIHVLNHTKAVLSNTGNYFNYLTVIGPGYVFKIRKAPKPSGRRAVVIDQKKTIWYSEGSQLLQINDSLDTKIKVFDKDIIWLDSDTRNNLWVGFYNGGIECYKNSDVFNSEPSRYLDHLSVSSSIADKDNGYWFTTLNEGVFYIPNPLFSSYTNTTGLLPERINCILPLNNKLWVGGNSNFLSCIDPDSIRNYKICDNGKTDISTMFFDGSGDKLWFSSSLSLHYLKNNKIHNITERTLSGNMKKYPYLQIHFNEMITGRNNILWLGSSKGLYNVVGNDLYLVNREISDKIRVNTLDEDNEGNIWIGNNEGVWVYTPEGKNGFDGTLSCMGDKYPLLKNRITAIHIDKKNNRYFFATKGAGLLIMQKGTVIQLLEKDGLLSNSTTSMSINGDDIWLGTSSGLNKISARSFSKKIFKIQSFTENHGLISNEITQVKIHGPIVFAATNKGLTIFDYTKTTPNPVPPPVYIEKIQVMDRDTFLKNNFSLAYHQNSVSFNFTGLSYKMAGNVTYKYRLDKDGDPGNWVVQDLHMSRFSFLSPGDYTFQVTARNEDGVWNEKPISISFKITPPYWKTWWFLSLVFLLAVSAVGLVFLIIFRIRINEARKRIRLKREEIRKRNMLLRDLNKYKQQVLNKQMNPHFIFNSLNSIQRYILKNDRIKSNLYLSKFATLMRIILNNSMQNLILIKEDLEALNLYLELEALRFEGKFEYSVEVKDEAILSCRIPPLFIQPFVENSIWHGLMPKNDKGKIIINFVFLNSGEILCTITDDGIGRKVSETLKNETRKDHKSLGTNLTSARLDVLNSLYHTHMKIEYHDVENNDGTPAGTRVNVTIPVIKYENNDEI